MIDSGRHHPQVIPDEEIIAVLDAADRGEVEIRPVGATNWMEQYCGIMEFHLGNGWKLGVFNDCCEWDYIEWIQAPDGRREDAGKGSGRIETFTASDAMWSWEPSDYSRWGEWELAPATDGEVVS